MSKMEDEYIELTKQRNTISEAWDNDPKIAEINQKIYELEEELKVLQHAWGLKINPVEIQLEEIQEQFKALYTGEAKKISLDRVVLSFRVTKSFKVLDKTKIAEVLVKNNQVEVGVSTFALAHLRKLADVNLLPVESYEYDEKLGVSVKEIQDDSK